MVAGSGNKDQFQKKARWCSRYWHLQIFKIQRYILVKQFMNFGQCGETAVSMDSCNEITILTAGTVRNTNCIFISLSKIMFKIQRKHSRFLFG